MDAPFGEDLRGSLRGGREYESSKCSSSSGCGLGKVFGVGPTHSPVGYLVTKARRQGPWRLAPLPRQQVNGQAGSAGQGPDARVPGVWFATQTPRMLASPKEVKIDFF